ncbi:MAG: glycosyltransferase family 4 protein [Anaerolineae bacterium]|nr:glycosyltransferase family 4 protein [Anaerolineae bacterium]
MHIAINAWFWDRPDTGSGQYTRLLTAALRRISSDLHITLIAPAGVVSNAPDGVTVQDVRMNNRGHLGKVGFEQQAFPDVAADLGADIAHVPYWGGPLQSRIPVVVTIHDIIPLILPEYHGGVLARLYTGLVSATARGAAAVITDSAHSRADILEHLGLPAASVHSIPLAAGVEFTPAPDVVLEREVRDAYALPDEFVLYLGGYDIRKNVRTLLKAYTYVQSGADDQFPLVLAGRLPAKRSARFDDVQHWIDVMELKNVVRPIGWIEEAHKPALYRMASCFAFPSRYEGFGLPVLEAMACGTPVVAAQASSLPEIVGDAGFLVNPDDARRMGGSILATLIQENVAQENRQKGLEQAKTFSWELTATETLAVYRSVLEQAAQ